MAINGEVKLTVSPTLHPANITSIDGYEAAKGYVADVVTVMDAAHQSVAAVIEARLKLNLDESRTERNKVLMTAQRVKLKSGVWEEVGRVAYPVD